METYLALLRGINVGGHKKVPMADLRQVLTESGLQNVKTYIQSGNVIFQSSNKSIDSIKEKISKAIESHFGFKVPVLVKTKKEMQSVFDSCPFSKEKKENSYFTLLYTIPEKKIIEEKNNLEKPANEEFVITDNCIYFYSSTGYGRTKYNNNFFERKLNVVATARNYKTICKLLQMLE